VKLGRWNLYGGRLNMRVAYRDAVWGVVITRLTGGWHVAASLGTLIGYCVYWTRSRA
jgi:hypothetical protein